MTLRIETEPGYRIPSPLRASPAQRQEPDVWILKLLDEHAEIGWAQLSLRRATGRYLGHEAGPAFVLDYLTIIDEFAGGVRALRRLFRGVLEFVSKSDEEALGLSIEPANDKIERLFGDDGLLPLPRVGEPPIFFVLSMSRIRAVMTPGES